MFLFEKRFIYKPIYASLKKIEAASFDGNHNILQ